MKDENNRVIYPTWEEVKEESEALYPKCVNKAKLLCKTLSVEQHRLYEKFMLDFNDWLQVTTKLYIELEDRTRLTEIESNLAVSESNLTSLLSDKQLELLLDLRVTCQKRFNLLKLANLLDWV